MRVLLFALGMTFLTNSSHAVGVPDSMKEKWEEVSEKAKDSYHSTRRKIDEIGRSERGIELKQKVHAARNSSFGQAIADAVSRLWERAKRKVKGGIAAIDRKLHEKVLGDSLSVE
ncbi:MAG TPA: hypothetical protein VIH99_04450 [Bdellovibrionota bacterium]|jgi:hypothetical protein